jgi:hypothetical protein
LLVFFISIAFMSDQLSFANESARRDLPDPMKNVKEACKSTAQTLCKDIKPGRGRVVQCLMEAHEKNQITDASCKTSIDEAKKHLAPRMGLNAAGRLEKREEIEAKVKSACKQETETFCPGKEIGKGLIHCLRENKDKFTGKPEAKACEDALKDIPPPPQLGEGQGGPRGPKLPGGMGGFSKKLPPGLNPGH